jgi:hypothetical protein
MDPHDAVSVRRICRKTSTNRNWVLNKIYGDEEKDEGIPFVVIL